LPSNSVAEQQRTTTQLAALRSDGAPGVTRTAQRYPKPQAAAFQLVAFLKTVA